MGQRELTDLEYAALLHDLGQVALREPIPRGATVMAAPADQQRIAHDGAEIVRSTGVLDNVAAILEAQTRPTVRSVSSARTCPMASRIIKVANAYDDLRGAAGRHDDARRWSGSTSAWATSTTPGSSTRSPRYLDAPSPRPPRPRHRRASNESEGGAGTRSRHRPPPAAWTAR